MRNKIIGRSCFDLGKTFSLNADILKEKEISVAEYLKNTFKYSVKSGVIKDARYVTEQSDMLYPRDLNSPFDHPLRIILENCCEFSQWKEQAYKHALDGKVTDCDNKKIGNLFELISQSSITKCIIDIYSIGFCCLQFEIDCQGGYDIEQYSYLFECYEFTMYPDYEDNNSEFHINLFFSKLFLEILAILEPKDGLFSDIYRNDAWRDKRILIDDSSSCLIIDKIPGDKKIIVRGKELERFESIDCYMLFHVWFSVIEKKNNRYHEPIMTLACLNFSELCLAICKSFDEKFSRISRKVALNDIQKKNKLNWTSKTADNYRKLRILSEHIIRSTSPVSFTPWLQLAGLIKISFRDLQIEERRTLLTATSNFFYEYSTFQSEKERSLNSERLNFIAILITVLSLIGINVSIFQLFKDLDFLNIHKDLIISIHNTKFALLLFATFFVQIILLFVFAYAKIQSKK